jgi:hypothetical protein
MKEKETYRELEIGELPCPVKIAAGIKSRARQQLQINIVIYVGILKMSEDF